MGDNREFANKDRDFSVLLPHWEWVSLSAMMNFFEHYWASKVVIRA